MTRAALALLTVAGLGLAACGGGSGSKKSAPAGPGLKHCERIAQPKLKAEGDEKPPKHGLDSKKRYDLVFETNCGTFTIRINPTLAPNAAASFVKLAKDGFYDGLTFHRVVPGFVIQGGDPTGTGAGGPGYITNDRLPSFLAYTKGVVAMAKSGVQVSGTSGSQFFIVTVESAPLPPDYAPVGRVTSGFDTVSRISALGDPRTQEPRQPVVIRSATVEEHDRTSG